MFELFYHNTVGLFFQAAKLYRIDLNHFDSKEELEQFNNFKFYMPVEKDLELFEKMNELIPGKLDIIKKRFESGNYYCFAYQDTTNNRLAYTRWLCKNTFYSEALRRQLDFRSDEAITLDSYTHPDYRYSGLHKNINIIMLQWLKANTPIRYVNMVILMFIPHLTKIPLELGYKSISHTFYYKKGSAIAFLNLLKNKIRV